jgi:hypothetical protein
MSLEVKTRSERNFKFLSMTPFNQLIKFSLSKWLQLNIEELTFVRIEKNFSGNYTVSDLYNKPFIISVTGNLRQHNVYIGTQQMVWIFLDKISANIYDKIRNNIKAFIPKYVGYTLGVKFTPLKTITKFKDNVEVVLCFDEISDHRWLFCSQKHSGDVIDK